MGCSGESYDQHGLLQLGISEVVGATSELDKVEDVTMGGDG